LSQDQHATTKPSCHKDNKLWLCLRLDYVLSEVEYDYSRRKMTPLWPWEGYCVATITITAHCIIWG